LRVCPEARAAANIASEINPDVLVQTEIQLKYDGYIEREKEQANKERLKGKGLEQPCYIEPPPPKKSDTASDSDSDASGPPKKALPPPRKVPVLSDSEDSDASSSVASSVVKKIAPPPKKPESSTSVPPDSSKVPLPSTTKIDAVSNCEISDEKLITSS
jgi:hypothetical protein